MTTMNSLIRSSLGVIVLASGVASWTKDLAAQVNRGTPRVHERHFAEFRYLIYRDDGTKPRSLLVLLDPRAFSEETLKKLFRLLSKRFPNPDWLRAEVRTSLDQIDTPEEVDRGYVSEVGDDPHDDHHARALLIRFEGNELIRYTPQSNSPYRELKTVILKGKDPFAPSRNN